jgi:hypothetical protein
MISDTQFRYRPPHHLAGGWCVFKGDGTNFHATIRNQDASAATLVMMGGTRTCPTIRLERTHRRCNKMALSTRQKRTFAVLLRFLDRTVWVDWETGN